MTPDLLIGMATGGVLMLAGIVVGRFSHAWSKKSERPPQAVCSCDHGYGMHDRETGKCHGSVYVQLYDGWNSPAGKELRPCACRHYDGPQPIEHYFATQTLPPRDSA